jgi:hypothetical protein
MKTKQMVRLAVLILVALTFFPRYSAAQQGNTDTTAARLIVTAETRHKAAMPTLNREDVMVYEGRDRDQVADWRPLTGDQAGLELFILVDDGLDPSFGGQLEVLRKFITSQPSTTAVGVGYVQNGAVTLAQNLTLDHNQAAKNLRLPLGNRGIPGSPYTAIQQLIAGWTPQQLRREIVLISDGIDGIYNGGAQNPYVSDAVAAAQKAGIVVFSIYAPAAGHMGHSYWRSNWGQSYLSQLSDETGGESYGLFMGAPVSIAPNLDDITQKLSRQYLLAFVVKPGKKAGFRDIKVKTEVPNVDLIAPDRVWVRGEE